MKCWSCRKKMKDGGWFFTDAPAGREIGLCDPCHDGSAPSKARREWRPLGPVRSVSTECRPSLFGAGDGLVRRVGLQDD